MQQDETPRRAPSFGPNDVLAFDLRGGRVGALSFCEVVQTWFAPGQTFQVDNHLSLAVASWGRLSDGEKDAVRFIYGHNFPEFKVAVGLSRRVRIISLLRHPLLKVANIDVSAPDGLARLQTESVQHELSWYRSEWGLLDTTSVESFLASHFFLGVTELIEESLFLLREQLGLEPGGPMVEWRRVGSHPSLSTNLYACGLAAAYMASAGYQDELKYYCDTRDRLLERARAAHLHLRADFQRYKRRCWSSDTALSKWSRLYPDLFLRPSPRLRQIARERLSRLRRAVRTAGLFGMLTSREKHAPSFSVPDEARRRLKRQGLLIRTQIRRSAKVEPHRSVSVLYVRSISRRADGVLASLRLAFAPSDRASRTLTGFVAGHTVFSHRIAGDLATRSFDVPLPSGGEWIALILDRVGAGPMQSVTAEATLIDVDLLYAPVLL